MFSTHMRRWKPITCERTSASGYPFEARQSVPLRGSTSHKGVNHLGLRLSYVQAKGGGRLIISVRAEPFDCEAPLRRWDEGGPSKAVTCGRQQAVVGSEVDTQVQQIDRTRLSHGSCAFM